MMPDLLTGKRIRLTGRDPEKDSATVASWGKDTEYVRLLEGDAVTPPNPKDWRERFEGAPNPLFFPFMVRTLDDDKLIGFVILMRIAHNHGNAYVGIGIGEPAYRGKGYGTEVMQVVLRFAFQELNLHRVSLDAVATNVIAVRSYEKCGFVLEGQTRGTDFRDRGRTNLVAMGILRSEWDKVNGAAGIADR